MSQFKQKERGQIHPLSLFYSVWILRELDDAHSHWGGQSAFLSSPILMLIFSGSTPTDTFRNNVLPALRASLSPIKLAHKINHYSNSI